MSIQPKEYQKQAVASALEIFRYAGQQLDAVGREATPEQRRSRRNVIAYNGCLLIQAPTGAGKTVIAGMLAEEFSRAANVVWFWFTPFAGLVEQSRLALKQNFQGLRLRDIQNERVVAGTRSGDVYVTTWASVAARNQESRRLRTEGETALALDSFVPELRAAGFSIGVMVDEAHHSFAGATEAVRFYTEVLQPEFTALITATPDDKDVARFQKLTGVEHMHRLTVSREDAVAAGLIKQGIKSVAYLAGEEQKQLVDLPLAALADGLRLHRRIKDELRQADIDLTPLMLVQVASSASNDDIEVARKNLLSLGVAEEAIATYTAKEPDDDLLTVAQDESKEVLIFKMAVALGFDAPRAFTLVSMRGARDADFGVQIVGRILRVHRRLQGREIPDVLRYGYVFLADLEKQAGLTDAAERINAIKTEFASVSPYTMVVNVVGKNEVQVVQNGQSSLLSLEDLPPDSEPFTDALSPEDTAARITGSATQPSLAVGWLLKSEKTQTGKTGDKQIATEPAPLPPGAKRFKLKDGIPRQFKIEAITLDTTSLINCIAATIAIDGNVFLSGMRETIEITRQEEEIFTRDLQVAQIQAELSESEIARRAQQKLFEADYIDPRDLQSALLNRLRREDQNLGLRKTDEELRRALNLILVNHPTLLKRATRECAAKNVELLDTKPLPEFFDLSQQARTARLNVYGVMPQDLNEDERALAELLDADTSETVEWWHRNSELKPWSVALVLPSGSRYFPDFLVKVRGRSRGDGILLVEVKGAHLLNSPSTDDKVLAEHKLYKRPLMVMREESGRWLTIRHNSRHGKNEPDQLFRIDLMAEF